MEFFAKAKAVKLKSHLNKYLIADDDQISTRQSRDGTLRRARWVVEFVETNPHVVRLKSCYGRYLTASTEPLLLGMTGHKVLQTIPENIDKELIIEWQPLRDGFQVKLKSFTGTYLRANGATPPWRNTVTHDSPQAAAAARDWVVWEVEAVDVPEDEEVVDYWSMVSHYSSVSDEISGMDFGFGSPISSGRGSFSGSASPSPRWLSFKKSPLITPRHRTSSAMDLFHGAKTVRLKSVHGKYLAADHDQHTVTQGRHGYSSSVKWTVEFVPHTDHVIRLKSCHNKYLTASNHAFLLGMTGRKVLQTSPSRLDSSVEWEPVRDNLSGGGVIKLKTRYGQFLRANGGLPPWKNSVTHDVPHRTMTQDWVCWEVSIVEIREEEDEEEENKPEAEEESFGSDSTGTSRSSKSTNASFSRQESNDSLVGSSPKASDGRFIYFHIADEYGEIDESFDELSITFKGSDVKDLTKKFEDELGLYGTTVCTRSPLNGNLYPLRLHLPPNNGPMHVIVVPPQSKAGEDSEETARRL